MWVVKREPHKGYLEADLWLPKAIINTAGVKNALTFQFAERTLALYQEAEHHLVVPREFWKYHVDAGFEIIDCRPRHYERTNVSSKIVLDAQSPNSFVQRNSVQKMLNARGGVLQLACGKGKTICALAVLTALQVPTIVIVDNVPLMDQWEKSIGKFLNVPGGVGRIEGSKFEWRRAVVLATYQTLAQRAGEFLEEFRRYFGAAIWDEGHHIGAPTFARTANLFYGRRYCLTATPERKDGLHIVHELCVGPILYKDLSQELKPVIVFRETGFRPNLDDPAVISQVYDSRGELHYGLLAGHMGRWRERLLFIVSRLHELVAEGRKILVLSTSIDELVNLLSVWNGLDTFYSDIPDPTEEELEKVMGEKVPPYLVPPTEQVLIQRALQHFLERMPREDQRRAPLKTIIHLEKALELILDQLEITPSTLAPAQKIELGRIKAVLKQGKAYRIKEGLIKKKQEEYLVELFKHNTNAGLMIHAVGREEREKSIHDKQITFAIAKYGREGLDSPNLDTVQVLIPGSQKGWIQQVMGRALRLRPQKKEPLIEIMEDDVSLFRTICHNLRRHLKDWSIEDGGPYHYENIRKEKV